MSSVTVQIDYGPGNGGLIAYYFDSPAQPKAIMVQAVHDGYVTIPKGAKTSGGREEKSDCHFPLARVVSIS